MFKSAEHMLQYLKAVKASDKAIAQKILYARTPYEAKQLGGSSSLIMSKEEANEWERKSYAAMKTTLIAKFANEGPRAALLNTGDAIIEEAAPYDGKWGTGRNGKGLNLLGKCLMEVREFYKEDE